MSLAIFERLIAIVENGTYGNASLGMKALRTFPDVVPNRSVLILPRASTPWARESSAHWSSVVSYDLMYFVQGLATNQNDALGIADASNFEVLATRIFLSRPQLQLFHVSALPPPDEVVGELAIQTTSNLAVPLTYPLGLSPQQGASTYWGFVQRLSIPTRLYVEYLPLG
jgi:hypothetical protein